MYARLGVGVLKQAPACTPCRRGSGESHEFCPLLKYVQVLRSSSLRLSSPPSYNTPPCEAPMPFTLRPYRRFPVQCAVTNNAGAFLKRPMAYLLGFWLLVTLKVLSSGPARKTKRFDVV